MTTAPNMATLERSLQKCSLNHSSAAVAAGFSPSSSSSSTSSNYALPAGDCSRLYPCLPSNSSSSTLVDLNSHLSLPYGWQQCLDLKTGEIYYINWRNGVKAKEDPRLMTTTTACYSYYSETEDSDEEEEEECYYSEGSSTGNSSPCKSGETNQKDVGKLADGDDDDDVLVVAGCKGCLMYYMVLKQTKDCPKCKAQLLHFDRPQNSDALL